MKVSYQHNNSGGVDWLNMRQVFALLENGWKYNGFHSLAKEFPSELDAVRDFERITGEDTSEKGCPCCGMPHQFMEDWDD
jgi:hypothetical protein